MNRINNAKKLLAIALEERLSEMNDEQDEVNYYSKIFHSAIPIIYYRDNDNPIKTRIDELYGNTFFLIYEPFKSMSLLESTNKKQSSFYLFLVRNEYTFEKYVDFFFSQANHNEWRANELILRNNKIKCFGCTRLLMLNEDSDGTCSQYKNAIALAFKNGSNPVLKDCRMKSYLYHNDKLIETPGFFEWDETTEKEFEQNERNEQA